ncbi:MAG: hypothetical protein AB7G62_08735 [Magnetospirillum sp.]
MSVLTVKFAVYGALVGGDENKSAAVDVSAALQALIDSNQGIVNINNDNMGGDPAYGDVKHFAAIVALGDNDKRYFACQEGQTIDFFHVQAG